VPDAPTLLAFVAVINALAGGVSQVIAALGHIQRPRGSMTFGTETGPGKEISKAASLDRERQ